MVVARHFTRADVDRFILGVFAPTEGEIVRVIDLKLLSILGCTPALWSVEVERQWRKNPPYRFTCVVAEYVIGGEFRLVCGVGTSLPAGYLTPAEEDAEIERARWQARAVRIAAESAEPSSEMLLPGEEALHEEVQA